jgi:osmotically inducible lipoprotein OsmB
MIQRIIAGVAMLGLFATVAACSTPITTREQGGLIGAGLGAGTGAIIGSTVGHAAVGALIGGPVGLIAGALIGDHLMGQEMRQQDLTIQSDQNQRELERLRRENERLRQERLER